MVESRTQKVLERKVAPSLPALSSHLPPSCFVTAEPHRAIHHHCAGSRAATGNQEGNEALTQAERLLSTVLLFVPRNSVTSMQEFKERSSSSSSSRGSPTLKVYVTVRDCMCLRRRRRERRMRGRNLLYCTTTQSSMLCLHKQERKEQKRCGRTFRVNLIDTNEMGPECLMSPALLSHVYCFMVICLLL